MGSRSSSSRGWWYTSGLRWPELDLCLSWSIFRWPAFDLPGWNLDSLRWLSFSLVDDVLWALVSVLESVALLAMLCYFFTFYGCTLWFLISLFFSCCKDRFQKLAVKLHVTRIFFSFCFQCFCLFGIGFVFSSCRYAKGDSQLRAICWFWLHILG